MAYSQPPSGGCVLKPPLLKAALEHIDQPPSGGCVLKLIQLAYKLLLSFPAAFGRLCVETG